MRSLIYAQWSSDRQHRGNQLVTDQIADEIWLGSTHQLVISGPKESFKEFLQPGLYLYDADTKKSKLIYPTTNRVLGTSPDGNWIYLSGR